MAPDFFMLAAGRLSAAKPGRKDAAQSVTIE
jgi:hypothetical protein